MKSKMKLKFENIKTQSTIELRTGKKEDGPYATGAACQQRTLTPPDTWSCPTLGLACVLMSRPISPELVLSPDLWISNIPRYFSFPITGQDTIYLIIKWSRFTPYFNRLWLAEMVFPRMSLRVSSPETALSGLFERVSRLHIRAFSILDNEMVRYCEELAMIIHRTKQFCIIIHDFLIFV